MREPRRWVWQHTEAMTASARKNAPRGTPKKRPARARPATKPTLGKPSRRVARVSEGPVGKLAVLANDADFQKQIAQHIERGVLAQGLANALREIFASAKWTREPAVSGDAMKAAEEFLAEVAKHSGPPPSDDELEEMLRSWA